MVSHIKEAGLQPRDQMTIYVSSDQNKLLFQIWQMITNIF